MNQLALCRLRQTRWSASQVLWWVWVNDGPMWLDETMKICQRIWVRMIHLASCQMPLNRQLPQAGKPTGCSSPETESMLGRSLYGWTCESHNFGPKMLNAQFRRKPSWSKCMDLKCTCFFDAQRQLWKGMTWREEDQLASGNSNLKHQGSWDPDSRGACDNEESVICSVLKLNSAQKLLNCFLLARTGLGQYLHGMEVPWDGTWFSKIGYERGRRGTIRPSLLDA